MSSNHHPPAAADHLSPADPAPHQLLLPRRLQLVQQQRALGSITPLGRLDPRQRQHLQSGAWGPGGRWRTQAFAYLSRRRRL